MMEQIGHTEQDKMHSALLAETAAAAVDPLAADGAIAVAAAAADQGWDGESENGKKIRYQNC